MTTLWGYDTAEELSDIITETEFDAFTASKYTGDVRISPTIASVSEAVRNYCGWHLSGSLECSVNWTAENRSIIKRGSDLIVQLPTRYLTEVTSVEINDVATTDYSFQTNGLLKIYDNGFTDRRETLAVTFTSGTDAGAIKELVAQMVALSLSKSYGITSESAGGVSITYNSTYNNTTYDTVMSNSGVLAPYVLRGVF